MKLINQCATILSLTQVATNHAINRPQSAFTSLSPDMKMFYNLDEQTIKKQLLFQWCYIYVRFYTFTGKSLYSLV